jgi:hypothetical protein
LSVIGGKHIRQHCQNAFLLVDCIAPQMEASALQRKGDGFVVSFGEAW